MELTFGVDEVDVFGGDGAVDGVMVGKSMAGCVFFECLSADRRISSGCEAWGGCECWCPYEWCLMGSQAQARGNEDAVERAGCAGEMCGWHFDCIPGM